MDMFQFSGCARLAQVPTDPKIRGRDLSKSMDVQQYRDSRVLIGNRLQE